MAIIERCLLAAAVVLGALIIAWTFRAEYQMGAGGRLLRVDRWADTAVWCGRQTENGPYECPVGER